MRLIWEWSVPGQESGDLQPLQYHNLPCDMTSTPYHYTDGILPYLSGTHTHPTLLIRNIFPIISLAGVIFSFPTRHNAALPLWRPLTFSTSILASSPCLPTEKNHIRLARSFTPIPYTLLLVPLLPQFSILLPTSTTPPSSSSSDVHLFHPPNYSHTKHIPIST